MIAAYSRMLRLVILLGAALPVIVGINSGILSGKSEGYWVKVGVAVALLAVLAWSLGRARKRLEEVLEGLGREQTEHLDGLRGRWSEVAVLGSAALSLFLELAVIRWQGTVWEFFSFYKNLGLLSCFAGLGLGYAIARSERLPLLLTAPLLAFQALLFITLRHGLDEIIDSLLQLPFKEQETMGIPIAATLSHYASSYSLIVVTFLLTALAFLPLGQLCGRVMERLPPLHAYRLNLLGSLAGVALMLVASMLWTPPAIWFLVAFAGLVAFQAFRTKGLAIAAYSALLGVAVLSWPTSVGWEKIYSPYQLLEKGPGDDGLVSIRAAGHYFQRMLDLSYARQTINAKARSRGHYYEFPYRVRETPPVRVAVVGAGSGNDVAGALRAGIASVDAIEIDPAIVEIGRDNHPEKPYADPRVHVIIDDARSFFRSTPERYDAIVYGLLDSHTLLSHASPVRVDSFVYTVEGLREARSRLTDNGYLSLSFSITSPANARKIYLMMKEAFDGKAPVCIMANYDRSLMYLQTKRGDLKLPDRLLASAEFRDASSLLARSQIHADVSTDDWPFFYMPKRVYPVSYLVVIGMLLALSLGFFFNFMRQRPSLGQMPFFFLGAGFMLVETKGITELGLAFGNTWQVIGFMIAGVLLMAYLANTAVETLKVTRPLIPYVLLLASLALGIFVSRTGGFSATPAGKLAAAAVLTAPLFFSGIVFSTLIARTSALAGAMALNLLGAMCGGLLEYNSMYFGFRFLYWLAIGLYLGAAITTFWRGAKAQPA